MESVRNFTLRSALCGCLMIVATATHAKLPPPTDAERAQRAEANAIAKAQLEKEQEALTRAQDRVADEYRRRQTEQGRVPAAPVPVGQTPQANLPKTITDPPRGAGPTGGTRPSAEAHSGNAK